MKGQNDQAALLNIDRIHRAVDANSFPAVHLQGAHFIAFKIDNQFAGIDSFGNSLLITDRVLGRLGSFPLTSS